MSGVIGVIDLTGHVFGKLTVLFRSGSKHGKVTWRCRCECGNDAIVVGRSLRGGETKSCGCLRHESRPRLIHGHNRGRELVTSTYVIWTGMIQRCTNPKNGQFHNYGGRGISVCERWMTFANFLDDMGERPLGMSIDRYPDLNGDYEPDNCRWATSAQQAQNNRRTRLNKVSVMLIRYMVRRGSRQSDLAHAFGVSRSNIGAVVNRETWQ